MSIKVRGIGAFRGIEMLQNARLCSVLTKQIQGVMNSTGRGLRKTSRNADARFDSRHPAPSNRPINNTGWRLSGGPMESPWSLDGDPVECGWIHPLYRISVHQIGISRRTLPRSGRQGKSNHSLEVSQRTWCHICDHQRRWWLSVHIPRKRLSGD